MFRQLMTSLFVINFVGLPMHLYAQKTVQQVEGGYIGLANDGQSTSAIVVEFDAQKNRSFSGELTLFQIDPIDLPIKGTIAASDKCKVVSDSHDRASLLLNWTNFGDGAAVLVGDGVVVNHEEQYSVGLLRPFNDLGIDWANGLKGEATFISNVDGSRSSSPIDLSGVVSGLFQGTIVDPDPLDVIGTSNTNGEVVVLGVGDGFILTIAGQVKINERTRLPEGIEGNFLIQTDRGKFLDSGVFFIEQDNL